MLYSMAKTSRGWKMVSKIDSVNGTPSCIGVQLGKGNSKVVALEVGVEVDLETADIKTYVNKGLCSRGFSSHYFKSTHSTTLASDDAGVVLEMKHAPKMYGPSRGRGGATLKRLV